MYETLLRPHEVYQRAPPRPLSEVIDKLKQMECYREEKRQRQIANAGKRKRQEDADLEQEGQEDAKEAGTERAKDKRARVDTAAQAGSSEIVVPAPPGEGADEVVEDVDVGAVAGPSRVPAPAKLNCSKVSPDVRGHTSYLTFARLVPLPPSGSANGNPTAIS